MKSKQFLRILAGPVACLCMNSAHAVTYNWTGAATPDTSFQTSGNWDQTWNEWGDYVFGSAATSGTGAVSINGRFGIHSISLASNLTNYDVTIGGSQSMLIHDTSSITIADTSKNLTINTNLEAYGTITWDIGTGRTFTLNGALTEWHTGGTSILKKGSGTAVLANTSNTYTGVTVLEGGILKAASFANNGTNSSLGKGTGDTDGNAIGLLFRGGTLQYTGSTAQSTDRAIRLSTTGGGGTIDASGSNPSATLNFTRASSPNLWENGGTRTLTLTGSNTGDNTLAMAINDLTGVTTINVTKSGAGKWVLSGSSNYRGVTDITGGTLVAASSTALGTGGHNVSTMTYIRDGATLALQGGISLDEHFHVWGNGVDNLGAVRSLSGNNALTNAPGGAAGYALRSNTTVGVDADTLTISGFYQDGGTFGITKVGAGTLKFSAGSSYGGQTDIKEGTLLAANSTALGTGGLSGTTLTNIRDGATLALQGGVSLDEHFHAWGNGVDGLGVVRSLSGNNALTLKDGSGNGGLAIDTNITVGVDADTLTASGFYHDTGSFGITKIGSGTLVLSDKSRYTGATNVNAGTLLVNGTTATGSAITVAAGSASGTPVAKLGGTGTIGGTVNLAEESSLGFKNGGVLAPTAAASGTKLSVTGTTTFGTGSIFEWNMSATNPATDPGAVANSGSYGQLAGNGAITGSNAVFKIQLGNGNSFTDAFWNTSKTWDNLFTGTGATIALTSIFSTISGTGITYESGQGTVAGRGYFTLSGTNTLNWTAVPEPTSALAGLLIGAGFLRRRRA